MPTPNVNLQHTRWRNDDGTEATATWLAAADTPAYIDLDTTYRARFALYSPGGTPGKTCGYQLQYRIESGGVLGAWTNVDGTSAGVRSWASGLADNADTTRQLLTGYTYVSPNKQQDDVNGVTAAVAITGGTGVDVEFAIQVRSAVVLAGDVVWLRIVDTSDWAALSLTMKGTVQALLLMTVTETLSFGEAAAPSGDIALGEAVAFSESVAGFIPPDFYTTIPEPIAFGEFVTMSNNPPPPYSIEGETVAMDTVEGETTPMFHVEGETA